MILEEAVNFLLAKGYEEKSRDIHRVVLSFPRLVRQDKKIVLTREGETIYFTSAKNGKRRRWPESWFSRWIASPHF